MFDSNIASVFSITIFVRYALAGMTRTPPYLADIQSQPAALQRLLDAGLSRDVVGLLRNLDRFDRIVLTGMGASLFAQYPAFLRLAATGLPVWVIETSELLGAAGGLVTPRSLVWITSQSGSSAEVAALLDRLAERRPVVLGVTNDTAGDLANRAHTVLEIHSGDEQTVGTRSYVNTLAAHELATAVALGVDGSGDLHGIPAALATYLERWDEQIETLSGAIGGPTIFLVGRGPSLAAVQTGALIIKEAAKVPVEGMSTPQFRHGPLEIVGPDVCVVHLAGEARDHGSNRKLRSDVQRAGGRSVWLGQDLAETDAPLPEIASGEALPIAEILPLQLLSVALAGKTGVEPGAFRHIQKVTRTL